MMRTILIVGLARRASAPDHQGAAAAPVNGTVIGDLRRRTDHFMPVQWGAIGDGKPGFGGRKRPPLILRSAQA